MDLLGEGLLGLLDREDCEREELCLRGPEADCDGDRFDPVTLPLMLPETLRADASGRLLRDTADWGACTVVGGSAGALLASPADADERASEEGNVALLADCTDEGSGV
jgi:hypothetical protein